MSITPFGRDPRERDELLRKLGTLPAAVEPARDLWPAIAARLGEQVAAAPAPRRPVLTAPWAAAAGVGIATVSVLFTWLALRGPAGDAGAPAAVVAAAPAPLAAEALRPVAYGPHSALGPEYLELRAALSAEFQRRVAQLAPETQAKVAENLGLIRKAAADIDAALAADPSSRLLNRLLLSTIQDELALYNKVNAVAPQPLERT